MVGNGLFPASAEAPAVLAFMLWTLVAAIVLLRRAMARVDSHVDPVRLSAGAPLPPAVAAAIRGDDPPR
jgi:hypothetical protein